MCLPRTKYTVILGEGTVEHAGFVDEFLQTGVLRQILLQKEDLKQEQISNEELLKDQDPKDNMLDIVSSRTNETSKKIDDSDTIQMEQPKKFTEDEKREAGAVKLKIYREYVKSSGGWLFWASVVFIFLAHQGFILGRVRTSSPSLLLGSVCSTQPPMMPFSLILSNIQRSQTLFALFWTGE